MQPQLPHERGRFREDAAAGVFLHTVHTTPFRAHHAGDLVELGQLIVHDRVIGVQEIEQCSIALKQISEDANQFLAQSPGAVTVNGNAFTTLLVATLRLVHRRLNQDL